MSALVEAVPILRSLLVDAQETWHHWNEDDVEALGIRARNAIDNLEQLVEASKRTVEAFKALDGLGNGPESIRAHLSCKTAMRAEAAALARVQGTA